MHRWGPYASGSRTLRYIGTGRSQGSTAVQFAYVRVKVSTLREVRAFLQPICTRTALRGCGEGRASAFF